MPKSAVLKCFLQKGFLQRGFHSSKTTCPTGTQLHGLLLGTADYSLPYSKRELNLAFLFVTGDTLSQAVDMIPLLIQSVEKAVNHPTQSALVTEAVSAGNLLLRLSARDINAGLVFMKWILPKMT